VKIKIFFSFFVLSLFCYNNAMAELTCLPASKTPDCPGSYSIVCRRACSKGFEYQYLNQQITPKQVCMSGMTQAGTCYGGYFEPGPADASQLGHNSAPDCNYVEPQVQKVKDIMAASDGKNMDMTGFLKQLPDDLRSNFIFMGKSQSFQTGTADNPRVIMTSERGDIRVTFGTSPNERGYNKVEISMWNPEKQAFDYKEMEFKNGKAVKHEDPTSCVQCHGDPAKPNWDNYNYWAGAIPSNKDTLVPGTIETEEYLKLIMRAEKAPASDPMSALILDRPDKPDDSGDRTYKKLKKRLEKKKENLQLNPMALNGDTFEGTAGGVGVMMFDRMVSRSGCTARRELREQVPRPAAFNSMKYILFGLANSCDMENFVPDWFSNLAANRFVDIKDMGVGAEDITPQAPPALTKAQSVMNDLIVDTDIRNKRIVIDKIGRQKYYHIQEYLRTGRAKNYAEAETKAQAEIEANRNAIGLNIVGVNPGNGNPANPYYDDPTPGKSATYRYRYQNGEPIKTIGEATAKIAKYRYFLEPFGVKMDRWSGSIDETSYTFSDIFDTIRERLLSKEDRDQIKDELGDNTTCENIASRSLASMTGNASLKIYSEKFVEDRCKDIVVTANNPIELLTGMTDNILDQQAREVFQTCMDCHTDDTGKGYTSGGPPVIPFNDLTKLKTELQKMRGSPTNLGYKIWERVQRHEATVGAMPQGYGSLSREELKVIRTFLERQNVFQK